MIAAISKDAIPSARAKPVKTMTAPAIAVKTNAGLKLPDIPKQVGEARQSKDEKIPFQSVMLYSRGLEAKDKGDKAGAVQLFSQAIKTFPGYDAPQKELDKLK